MLLLWNSYAPQIWSLWTHSQTNSTNLLGVFARARNSRMRRWNQLKIKKTYTHRENHNIAKMYAKTQLEQHTQNHAEFKKLEIPNKFRSSCNSETHADMLINSFISIPNCALKSVRRAADVADSRSLPITCQRSHEWFSCLSFAKKPQRHRKTNWAPIVNRANGGIQSHSVFVD